MTLAHLRDFDKLLYGNDSSISLSLTSSTGLSITRGKIKTSDPGSWHNRVMFSWSWRDRITWLAGMTNSSSSAPGRLSITAVSMSSGAVKRGIVTV